MGYNDYIFTGRFLKSSIKKNKEDPALLNPKVIEFVS